MNRFGLLDLLIDSWRWGFEFLHFDGPNTDASFLAVVFEVVEFGHYSSLTGKTKRKKYGLSYFDIFWLREPIVTLTLNDKWKERREKVETDK